MIVLRQVHSGYNNQNEPAFYFKKLCFALKYFFIEELAYEIKKLCLPKIISIENTKVNTLNIHCFNE